MTRIVAFADRQGNHVFVPAPGEYGRWVRVARYVALVDCPACGSPAGVPCVGQYGRHADRMVAAKKFHRSRYDVGEDEADRYERASPEADACRILAVGIAGGPNGLRGDEEGRAGVAGDAGVAIEERAERRS